MKNNKKEIIIKIIKKNYLDLTFHIPDTLDSIFSILKEFSAFFLSIANYSLCKVSYFFENLSPFFNLMLHFIPLYYFFTTSANIVVPYLKCNFFIVIINFVIYTY